VKPIATSADHSINPASVACSAGRREKPVFIKTIAKCHSSPGSRGEQPPERLFRIPNPAPRNNPFGDRFDGLRVRARERPSR
jgi:hypothetical protein